MFIALVMALRHVSNAICHGSDEAVRSTPTNKILSRSQRLIASKTRFSCIEGGIFWISKGSSYLINGPNCWSFYSGRPLRWLKNDRYRVEGKAYLPTQNLRSCEREYSTIADLNTCCPGSRLFTSLTSECNIDSSSLWVSLFLAPSWLVLSCLCASLCREKIP